MPQTRSKHHDRASGTRFARAFTIIELLVSIAIIFLLIAAASVALKAVRKGANRTETMQALRQQVGAYNAYSAEHNGRLLPGFIDPNDLAPPPPTLPGMIDIQVRNPGNTAQWLTNADKAGYVWRLAPYLDGNWKTMMTDYRSPQIVSRFNDEFAQGIYGPGTATAPNIGIGEHPAYGLNGLNLGGDSYHGSATMIAKNPWATPPVFPNKNRIAALRASEVLNPAKIIVFAPTEDSNWQALQTTCNTQLHLGSVELRPPWGIYDRTVPAGSPPVFEQQWDLDTNSASPTFRQVLPSAGADYTNGGGWPTDRLGENKIPVAHLDGNVELLALEVFHLDQTLTGAGLEAAKATMMSYWSPFAIGDR